MGKSHSFLHRALPLLALTALFAVAALFSMPAAAQELVADFTSDVTHIPPGGVVNFIDASTSELQILKYTWDFGDGATMDGQLANPSHQYTAVGVYTVSLTITNSANSQDNETKVAYVVVQEPPFVWFIAIPEVS
ncbi:MAG: PKD domain-containing protein, partial [Candidatus Hydrogenedentes bacterium]|nr:PKD domain-containing protein [Candidatus Hydrogenedentota bacterium]